MGSLSPGNRLIVSNGATACANSFIVGFTNTSLNNRIIVDGGMLIATNPGSGGLLDLRRGTNVFNSGLIEVDRLLVTNMPSFFEFSGGTLITKSTTNNIGRAFNVGNGVSAATLSLAGNGVHNFFAVGLMIRSNASLIGNGTIHGPVTVQNGGTLAPGASIGKLMLINSIILQGSTIMEIRKRGQLSLMINCESSAPLPSAARSPSRTSVRPHWVQEINSRSLAPAVTSTRCYHHIAAAWPRLSLDKQAVGGRFNPGACRLSSAHRQHPTLGDELCH